MNIYWGDLHNHCAVSYGEGTIASTLANARNQLDFCTITGHAFWPDMPMDLAAQNRIIGMHLGGFAKLQHYWPELQHQLNTANRDGEFITLPSYEWHSMLSGDYNIYTPEPDLALINGSSLSALRDHLRSSGKRFFMLPHHCAYPRGFRGTDWKQFDAIDSPLVEIHSNHGSGEADDAVIDYHHSMGPRVGESTVRSGLLAGHRFGFYASSDSHDGYPGHYGHGRTGVYASRLDRESIWQALEQRRTIATTGAAICGSFSIDSASFGGTTAWQPTLPYRIQVEACAPLQGAELVYGSPDAGWEVQPLPTPSLRSRCPSGIDRYRLRIETGWGRGDQLSSWLARLTVSGGRLLTAWPAFRFSAPATSADATDKIISRDEHSISWQCRSRPHPAGLLGGTHFSAGGTQSIFVEIEGSAGTTLSLEFDQPAGAAPIVSSLAKLCTGSIGSPVAGFGSAAAKIHRVSPSQEWSLQLKGSLDLQSHRSGFCYLRVRQIDLQTAWFSPIFFS